MLIYLKNLTIFNIIKIKYTIIHNYLNKEKKVKLLKWKDEYSMNEENIDKQHKSLFKLSNEIYDLVEKGIDDYEHFRKLFLALNDYGIEHFLYEEMYMQEQGYPDLKEHIRQHNEFSNKLKDLCIGIDKETHIREIGEFVSTWLVEHVLNEDMEYKEFVENRTK